MCRRVSELARKPLRIDTLSQAVGQYWTAEREERVTSYRGRVKDGEAKGKLGLIAECGLAEHLPPPPLPSSEKVYSLSAGSPSYNNEFPWSADMLLNIH